MILLKIPMLINFMFVTLHAFNGICMKHLWATVICTLSTKYTVLFSYQQDTQEIAQIRFLLYDWVFLLNAATFSIWSRAPSNTFYMFVVSVWICIYLVCLIVYFSYLLVYEGSKLRKVLSESEIWNVFETAEIITWFGFWICQ